MNEIYSRTESLLGKEKMQKLLNSRVAVFGIGGVGGYAAEVLARSGIGNIDLFDCDTVSASNINRQIIALKSTLGLPKVTVMENRIHDINSEIRVCPHNVFYSPENSADFDLSCYDYIIDAIDSVSSKIELTVRAKENNIPIISSMGTGNKINPERLSVSDIYKTSVCPLARVMRYELKKRNIKSLKVVYSPEKPMEHEKIFDGKNKEIPASTAFVPAAAGILLASEVVKDLTEIVDK